MASTSNNMLTVVRLTASERGVAIKRDFLKVTYSTFGQTKLKHVVTLLCTGSSYSRGHLHSLLITLNNRYTSVTSLEMPRKKNLYLLLLTMILQSPCSETQFACWSIGLACETGMHTEVKDKDKMQKHNEKHRDKEQADMHDLFCLADQATQTAAQRRRSRTSRKGA